MIRYKWLTILSISSLAIVFLYLADSKLTLIENIMSDDKSVSKKCICIYKGQTYDFCYHIPHDKSVEGKRFDCNFASDLDGLGLLSPTNLIDLGSQVMPQPAFISALSESHYKEGLTMLANFRAVFPHQKIFIYDLGLKPESRKDIESKCLVEMRTFPFDRFRANLRNLPECRWKAILIATTAKEFGAVWYMDTSIRWMKDVRSLVYNAYANSRKNGVELPSAVMFHLHVNRSTYVTTHPETYTFIPTNMREIKKKSCLHALAGFMFFIRTADAIEILKWYVLCSFEQNCMAPSGAKVSCDYIRDPYNQYANCHRFDQSVVNLLLANAYRCNVSNYLSDIGKGAKVIHNEDHSLTEIDFACPYREVTVRNCFCLLWKAFSL
ncbi:unnamed protein product [Cylicocyclus nassatus]|uniref:Uncharacterized protein n=1 Tax=Cylicocyclus nassatus TaxID=53992 RepID=A0AA36GHM5_CYLNA|nr:unnamed protein product [Cylicocyclus nassatus]